MRYFLTTFAFCFMFCFSFAQTPPKITDYEKIFPKDFPRAIAFLKKNKPLIAQMCETYQVPTQAICVAAAELLRYDELQDRAEIMGNKILYRNFGEKYSDFSIGYFQMKPSFIEKLEKCVQTEACLKQEFGTIFQYKPTDSAEIRGERVQRLENATWQLRYLICFYKLMRHRFPLAAQTEAYRLRFYATAYNHGYEKGSADIMLWMDKKVFPKGLSGGYTQYAFSDVANYFYVNWQRFSNQ
ncbi:MAG: hypothetical protein ACKVTZ_14430 [Bacteroidia bacterium]